MRFQTLGDKSAFIANNFKNAETVTISRGAPAIMQLNGTNDGLAVVLPSTAGQGKSRQLFVGVALDDLAPGQVGQFQNFGFCRTISLVVQTRSATSGGASWSSVASIASLVLLDIETINNVFITAASTTALASTDTLAVTAAYQLYHAILAANVASTTAGTATATSDTRTALTIAAKAFLRSL